MFIFERLISLGFFFLAILIACFLMARVKGKQYKLILFLYLLVLTVFAWSYEPYITADLYRLRQYIEAWIYKPWYEALSMAFHSMTPSWFLFSYVTNQFDNENWMQSIACLWCYGNIFLVLAKIIARFDLQRNDRGFLLFYIMAIGALYLQVISGIRTMLGFSIVYLCVYREYFEQKSIIWNLPLYIIAAFFHNAVLVLVCMRFLVLGVEGKSGIGKVLHIFLTIGICFIGLFYGYDYLLNASDKAVGYMTNDAEYTYLWEYLIGSIEIIQILLLCYFSKKEMHEIYHVKSSYIWMTILFCIGCVAFMPLSYAIFRRFTIFATMLSLPILGMFLKECTLLNQKSFYWERWWIKILSIIIMFLSFARGDLCGYKFF